MQMGRPPKYSDEILEQTKRYMEEYTTAIPSVAGLSVYLKIARSTIYEWAGDEDKQNFSDIIQELLALQENKLLDSGLRGEFNSTITKLILSKHGYTDKTDVTSNDEKIETGVVILPSKEER